MSTITDEPAIGFIGLGDQGLPMATAIATALAYLATPSGSPRCAREPASMSSTRSSEEDGPPPRRGR